MTASKNRIFIVLTYNKPFTLHWPAWRARQLWVILQLVIYNKVCMKMMIHWTNDTLTHNTLNTWHIEHNIENIQHINWYDIHYWRLQIYLISIGLNDLKRFSLLVNSTHCLFLRHYLKYYKISTSPDRKVKQI